METTLLQYKRVFEFTQRELAERLGVSQPYLSQLCGGKTKPTIEVARRIASLTDTPITQILFEYGILTSDEITTGGAQWAETMSARMSSLDATDRKKLIATLAAIVEVAVAGP